MTYSEIINSFWFSDNEQLRDALTAWANSKVGCVYYGSDGAVTRTAINADYIARFFSDDYLQSEVIKRIPQKRLIEIYNYYTDNE